MCQCKSLTEWHTLTTIVDCQGGTATRLEYLVVVVVVVGYLVEVQCACCDGPHM